MNETEIQMCERCGELPAVTVVERGNVGECVCAECIADERQAAVDFYEEE